MRFAQRCRSVVGPAGRPGWGWAGLAVVLLLGVFERRVGGRTGAAGVLQQLRPPRAGLSGLSRAAALVSARMARQAALAAAVHLASGHREALGGVPSAAAGAIGGGGRRTHIGAAQVPLAEQRLVRAPGGQVGALVGEAARHFARHDAHSTVQAGLQREGHEGKEEQSARE